MEEKQITYEDMVRRLAKPGEDIQSSLSPLKCHLWHMASCVQGEAGELFDGIKKYIIYDKTLNLDNVIEELGDIEFYLEGLRQGLAISREETLRANIAKLSVRYAKLEYSDAAARERADKAEYEQRTPERKFMGQPPKEA